MPGQDANEHTSGIETGPLERAAPGYLQAVERCLALLVPAKRRWDEAPWPELDGQQYKKYLKSYYVATIENLDQLGLTKVITPEEIRQLCVFKLLYPTAPNLEAAVSVNRCGPEIGIQHSRRDFDRNLSICLSFAYRKGVRDELKDQAKAENHVDQEGQRDKGLAKNRDREGEAQNSPNIFYENNHWRERRAEVEQSCNNLLGRMQTRGRSRLITEAYAAGRSQTRCVISAQKMPGEIHLE
jgi:hypothetical protein